MSKDLKNQEWIEYFIHVIQNSSDFNVKFKNNTWAMSQSVRFLFSTCEQLERTCNTEVCIDVRNIYGIPLTFDKQKTIQTLQELKSFFMNAQQLSIDHNCDILIVKISKSVEVMFKCSEKDIPSNILNISDDLNAIVKRSELLSAWKRNVSRRNTQYFRNFNWWCKLNF